MTTLLSPLAPPFMPPKGYESPPEFELCICNDGVPTLSPCGVKCESELLRGFADEAIDDYFPPTAQEVAEIEAAEMFVSVMARLAHLEEMEEHARFDFGHIKKRWEARREEGLVGKPRPAIHKRPQEPNVHAKKTSVGETSIIPYDHYHKPLCILALENRARAKADPKRMVHHYAKIPKNVSHNHKLIQQPRKQLF